MILLSTLINTFKQSFLQQYKNALLPSHQKALWAMEGCRQAHGPHMLAQCTCGQRRYIPHFCGHRNCPHCQNHESQQWIENQLGKHLPAEYYLITFTLPSQLRPLAWNHQRMVYSLMFDCLQDTLKTFTRNDKKLGGEAIIYLGKYLYRGVIQEKDILACENGRVTFRYRPATAKAYQTRTVTGEKFLYLLTRHLLPKGFRRVRSYGFLHPCSKKLIQFLQLVLRVNPLRMLTGRDKQRPPITCPRCGATMKIMRTQIILPMLA